MASQKKDYDSDYFGNTPFKMTMAAHEGYPYDNPNFAVAKRYPIAYSGSEYSNDESLMAKKNSSKRFLALIVLLCILLIAALMTVGIYFAVNQTRTLTPAELPKSRLQTNKGTKEPDAILSVRGRNYNWDQELADTQSKRFAEVATAFEKEIDDTFRASDMADIYDFSVVTGLRAGSVVADCNVVFQANTVATTDAQKQKKAKFKQQPETFLTAVNEAFVARAKQRAENNDESGVVIDTATVVAKIVTTTSTTTTNTPPPPTTTTTTLTTITKIITQPTSSETTESEMTTVETTDSEMTTMQTTESEMTTVEITESEMTNVETTESEMTTVGTTESEMTTMQTTESEMTTVEITESEMTTVETTESEMSTVGTTESEMTTVETTESEMTTVETTNTKMTTLQTEPTSPPPETEVLPDLGTNLTLTNYTWNDALNDTESPEYKNLSTQVVAQVDMVMENSNMSEYYNRTEVQSMRQGSVIVICVIIMNPIPIEKLPEGIADIKEKPEKFVEVFKEGVNNVRKIREEDQGLPPAEIEFDVAGIAVVVVNKRTKCEDTVLDIANLCVSSFHDMESTFGGGGDICPPYKYFVNCLKIVVQYLGLNQCHVYHVSKAAVFYVNHVNPGRNWGLESCEDTNGQVGAIVDAPTRTDNLCMDAQTVKYLAKYECSDHMEQVRTDESSGNCSVLDTLNSCIHEWLSAFANYAHKELHCSTNDVKKTLIDYKDEIIQRTNLPDICFGIEQPERCYDVNLYRNYSSFCESEISEMKEDPTCGHLMNVSLCLTNAMCEDGTHCTTGQMIMAISNSSISEDWLGLRNVENVCDDRSLPVNVCEDRSAITCVFLTCAPQSMDEFVQLSFSSQCRAWDNMTLCTMDKLAKAGHICEKRNVSYIIDRFGQNTIQFSAKECSEGINPCLNVSVFKNYTDYCSDTITVVREDPTCKHLQDLASCLSSTMCDLDGLYCGDDQIVKGFQDNRQTVNEWLRIPDTIGICEDEVTTGICNTSENIECIIQKCASGLSENFEDLEEELKCRAWDNMTQCTMDKLAKAGHICEKRNVSYIIDRFGQNAINFSAKECSEGINPCLNVSVFKNYTEYCSDTITAVREDPTCKHLQDLASCLSSTMCEVDGLYCGDDQIVKGFQDDRQTVNEWLRIPDTIGICEDEVTTGICNTSENIECIIQKCASGLSENFEDLEEELKCRAWDNMTQCTMDKLAKAGHICEKRNVSYIIDRFGQNAINFSAKECSEGINPCLNVSVFKNYTEYCSDTITAVREDPTCKHLQDLASCLSSTMCEVDGLYCGDDQIVKGFQDDRQTVIEWLRIPDTIGICEDEVTTGICNTSENIECIIRKCGSGLSENFEDLEEELQCRAWDNMTQCTMDKLAKAGHICEKRNVSYIIDRFGQNAINFSAKECSEGINPCLNVSVFKNYTEYCSDTITAVREDPTCKHLQDLASCLSSTMCEVDGLYCGDDQIVKGFQDDRQTVIEWLRIPDTIGICEDEVTTGICNTSENIECIIRKCGSGLSENFEDLEEELQCRAWDNMTQCTMDKLAKAGHICEKRNVSYIIDRFGQNAINFSAKECSEGINPCLNVSVFKNYTEYCSDTITAVREDPTCKHLQDLASCLSSTMCEVDGLYCGDDQIVKGFQDDRQTVIEWLRIPDTIGICEDEVTTGICNTSENIECIIRKCGSGLSENFEDLEEELQCRAWDNMTQCTMDKLAKAGHICEKRNVSYIIDRFGQNAINFSAKECSEGINPCLNVSVFKNYTEYCSDTITAVREDPTCKHLQDLASCLSSTMCEVDGLYCGDDQIVKGFQDDRQTVIEWLRIPDTIGICEDEVTTGICNTSENIECIIRKCGSGLSENFEDLEEELQCRAWDNMTQCTMDKLAKAGHICEKRNVSYIIDRFGQNAINFSAKECSEGINPCLNVSVFKNYTEYCSDTITAVREDPTCKHLQDLASCLSSTMCEVDGLYCGDDQIVKGFQDDRQTVIEWLRIPDTIGICEDEVTTGICNTSENIECIIRKCGSGLSENFEDLEEELKCRAWDNMTQCTMDKLAKAGHICEKRNVSYIIDRFGQNAINFSAKECSEGINPCLNVSVFKNYTEYCSDTITAVREDPTCKHLQDLASCLSSTMCEVDGLYCGDDQIVKGFQDDRQTVIEWLRIPDTIGICEDEVTTGICNTSENIECIIRKCGSGLSENFEDLEEELKCSIWGNITNCTLETISDAGHDCSSTGVENIINDFFLKNLSFNGSLQCGDYWIMPISQKI